MVKYGVLLRGLALISHIVIAIGLIFQNQNGAGELCIQYLIPLAHFMKRGRTLRKNHSHMQTTAQAYNASLRYESVLHCMRLRKRWLQWSS